MNKITFRAGLLSGAMAVCALASMTLAAVPAHAKGQLIATVDLIKVYSDDWTTFKVKSDLLNLKEKQFTDILSEFPSDEQGSPAALPPLPDADLQAWINQKEKVVMSPTPSEADQSALVEMERKGKTALARLIELQNKGALQDPEKSEMEKLSALQGTARTFLLSVRQSYITKLQDEAKKTREDMDVLVKNAIKAVAADQGVTYVLNATIVSNVTGPQQTVLFPDDKELDLTAKVIDKLNKTKPAK